MVRGHLFVLEVRGRKSSKLSSLPADPLDVGGRRYLVGVRGNSDWARNARAAGVVMLARAFGRQRYAVGELPPDDRLPVLKAYLNAYALEGQQFFSGAKKRQMWRRSPNWRDGIRRLN